MKLHLLNDGVERFCTFILRKSPDQHLYKYRLLDHIDAHWDLSPGSLAEMYDQALQSDVTTRWWNRPAYNPKEAMQLFITMEPEYVRQAFKDLLDETKSIDRRIDRFQFYCDELLRMYKQRHRNSIVNHHYHDASMISVYLAARYPTVYTLYPGEKIFATFLQAMEAPAEDLSVVRFFKVARIVMKYLMQRDEYAQLPPANGTSENLLLAHSAMYYLSGYWDRQTP